MFKKKAYIIVLIVVTLSLIITHFLTLWISPLPWYDEVAFATITKNFQTTGKFLWPEHHETQEILFYGPVYFILQSKIIAFLGWGTFQFRLLNFLSSLLLIGSGILILKKLKVKQLWLFFYSTFLLIDIMYFQNAHSGRMDLFAALLSFISFIIFLTIARKKFKSLLQVVLPILSGIIFSLSFLTTPRILFMLGLYIGYVIYISSNLKLKKYLLVLSLWSIGFISVLGVYVHMKFGGFSNYLEYYLSNSLLLSHVGSFNLIRYYHHIPLYILFLYCLYIWIRDYRKLSNDYQLSGWSILSTSIFYFLFVKEVGPYIAMLIPFLYLFVIGVISNRITKPMSNILFRGIVIAFGLIFFINIGAFSLKLLLLNQQYKARSPKILAEIVKSRIPANSCVIGDYKYFYSIINNNSFYYSIDSKYSTEDWEDKLINDYEAQYLITGFNIGEIQNSYKKIYSKIISSEKIFDYSKNEPSIISWLRYFGYKITLDYGGYIYKLKK